MVLRASWLKMNHQDWELHLKAQIQHISLSRHVPKSANEQKWTRINVSNLIVNTYIYVLLWIMVTIEITPDTFQKGCMASECSELHTIIAMHSLVYKLSIHCKNLPWVFSYSDLVSDVFFCDTGIVTKCQARKKKNMHVNSKEYLQTSFVVLAA